MRVESAWAPILRWLCCCCGGRWPLGSPARSGPRRVLLADAAARFPHPCRLYLLATAGLAATCTSTSPGRVGLAEGPGGLAKLAAGDQAQTKPRGRRRAGLCGKDSGWAWPLPGGFVMWKGWAQRRSRETPGVQCAGKALLPRPLAGPVCALYQTDKALLRRSDPTKCRL